MRTGNHNELIEIFHVDYKDKSLKNFDDLKKLYQVLHTEI